MVLCGLFWDVVVDAIEQDNAEVLERLLRLGLDPNERTPWPAFLHLPFLNRPLLLAVGFQKPQSVSVLLRYGADPNTVDLEGLPALLLALRGGVMIPFHPSLPIVRELLRFGADPNVRDERGQTPLSIAQRLRVPRPVRADFVRALEEAGAV